MYIILNQSSFSCFLKHKDKNSPKAGDKTREWKKGTGVWNGREIKIGMVENYELAVLIKSLGHMVESFCSLFTNEKKTEG